MAEKHNLLISVPLEEKHVAILRKRFPSLNINIFSNFQEEPVPEEIWAKTEILYTHRLLPDAEQAQNLRWIQFHNAGINKYIAHPLFEKKDLIVSTLSGANAPQTAEHALTLLLALSHNVPTMLADQSRNKWSASRLKRYQPHELYGSTVGIVGYGSVGQHLARLLHSFNATVLASKRDLLKLEDSGYHVPYPEEDTEYVARLYPGPAMRSMFKDCDFVVICLPLTKDTRNMISSNQLAALKADAYLVDVSRGGVLDHEALIDALKNEHFAGAALDVFPEEPLPADNPLWDMPNVLISPHVAGFSPHYLDRAIELFIVNLERYLAAEEVLNIFDRERSY
jgi:phosphoglycerate dehydrogenase-like enzyme